MKEVLNVITDNLMNERLDDIIQKNNNYQEIAKRVHEALLDLKNIDSNTKDIQKIIEEYDVVVHEESSLYARLSYQQGMKDVIQLLFSLIV
ncbi:MAG: hypothetical protein NC433_16900 [Clostridiales bacterium]|nr:hypothetical protein [Clostridiales bacterium]MCM1263531.1 hypothetical protein [Butyrivibrio sp.]